MREEGRSITDTIIRIVEKCEEQFRKKGAINAYIDWEAPDGNGRSGAILYWHPEEKVWKTESGTTYSTIGECLQTLESHLDKNLENQIRFCSIKGGITFKLLFHIKNGGDQ